MEPFILVLVLILGLFLIDYSSALSCYSYDGFSYPDQQICPGTSQCCGVTANCTANRLCEKEGERVGTFVRGPCAVHPWDPAVCATICLYDEQPQGGVFPRVTVCNDGSYCCDNDSACCANGKGVFLDRAGNIIGTPTPSTASPSDTQITSSSSTPSGQTSVIPSASKSTPFPTPSNSSSSLSQGAKVGLGVGISVGAIGIAVLAVIAWVFWKRRRSSQNSPILLSTHTPSEVNDWAAYPTPHKDSYQHQVLHELPSGAPQELDAGKSWP